MAQGRSGGIDEPGLIVVSDGVRRYLWALWPDLDLSDLSIIETGWDSRVAEVNGEWIFRVPRTDHAARMMAVEARLLPELVQVLPAPIPKYEYLSLDPPCAGYRKIGGATLDSSEASVPIGRQIGSFLRALHSFPIDRAAGLGVPGADDASRSVLLSECDEFRRRVLPLLGGSDARRGAGLLDGIVGRDSTFDFEPTLVHADLGPDHILCTTSAISGVIDWGDVRIGDPAIDLSWLMNSLRPAMRKAIGEAYGSVAGDTLTARAVNWHRLGPWHEVIYGLDVGRPEFVARGLAGVRARLPP